MKKNDYNDKKGVEPLGVEPSGSFKKLKLLFPGESLVSAPLSLVSFVKK